MSRDETKPKRRGGGYPPFRPTRIQRQLVVEMAGLKCSWEEMRRLIVNNKTGRGIAKTTFSRVFARELEMARAKLKAVIASGFHAALQRQEPWALRLSLKNCYGWSLEGAPPAPVLDDEGQQRRTFELKFLVPDPPAPKQIEPPKVIDAEPQSPPYRPQSALPAPPERRWNSKMGWME
jgi:hypothetical protein